MKNKYIYIIFTLSFQACNAKRNLRGYSLMHQISHPITASSSKSCLIQKPVKCLWFEWDYGALCKISESTAAAPPFALAENVQWAAICLIREQDKRHAVCVEYLIANACLERERRKLIQCRSEWTLWELSLVWPPPPRFCATPTFARATFGCSAALAQLTRKPQPIAFSVWPGLMRWGNYTFQCNSLCSRAHTLCK